MSKKSYILLLYKDGQNFLDGQYDLILISLIKDTAEIGTVMPELCQLDLLCRLVKASRTLRQRVGSGSVCYSVSGSGSLFLIDHIIISLSTCLFYNVA